MDASPVAQLPKSITSDLLHIHQQFLKGNQIQTSSSNMLLMNVEDVLGYA